MVIKEPRSPPFLEVTNFYLLLRPTGLALRAQSAQLAQRKRCSAQPQLKEREHYLMAQPPRLGKAGYVTQLDFCADPTWGPFILLSNLRSRT